MEQYRDNTLSGDIMYVDKIPFFVTYSQYICFGTVEVLENQKAKTLIAAMKVVKSVYAACGFTLIHVFRDNEFEPLRADLHIKDYTEHCCPSRACA
jgi:hypothetical protein